VVAVSVRVSKVEDEALGEAYCITTQDLPNNLAPVRFYVWRCPICKAEVHAWTLKQLNAVIQNHKKKHGGRNDG
jgi:hypothetical protein